MMKLTSVIDQGLEAWSKRRELNPTAAYKFEPMTIRGKDLTGFDFSSVDLTGSVFDQCVFRCTCFDKSTLTDVQFQNSKFESTTFNDAVALRTRFHSVQFHHCTFAEAALVQSQFVQCQADSTIFIGADLDHAFMAGMRFNECNFSNARLTGINFSSASAFGVPFVEVKAYEANFAGADLCKSNFSNATLDESILAGARLREANLSGASLFAAKLDTADCFKTIFESAAGIGAEISKGLPNASMKSISHEEDVLIGSRRPYLQWQAIRKVGELPLFGVSYFGIAAIAVWTSIVHLFNQWVDKFQEKEIIGHQWLQQVPHVTVSHQTVWALLGLVITAVGATIYKLACPPEIQEYTETRWATELNRSRLQYRAMGTRAPIRRFIAFTCYLVGCPILLALLGYRIFWATVYAFTG